MENEEVAPAEAAEVTEEVQVEEPAEEVVEQVEEPAGEVVQFEQKKKTAQERIDEITKARREAEREREYWKKVALEKEPPTKIEPVEVAPRLPARPAQHEFDTQEEYEDALLVWHDTKKTVQTEAQRQKAAQDDALKSFNVRAKELRATYDDFDEVIEAPVFSPIMRTVIANSEHGPEVAYFLGKPENEAVAEKIRNLPTEMQPYEIAKLESRLLLAKQTKKVPGAPPPLKPVGLSGGSTEDDTSKMSMTEFMEWDRQRTLEKLKAKYG
jgi:hypothetical protein